MCCCAEDSILFCSGIFLTPNQRKYSNLDVELTDKKKDAANSDQINKSSKKTTASTKTSESNN